MSFAALGSLLIGSTGVAQAQYTATVDLNTRYQTFEGWGTSLAWWANVIGGYPDSFRSDYINQFFDPVTGLGLNIVRYNIGGGENPLYLPPNSTYLQYRARVPGFEPTPGTYDWTQDANQRWVLQQSIQKGVTIEEAFSNSPPYWMTNSGSVTGAVGAGDNLNPSYTADFADYLTTVTQHFHNFWGVTFRTLEALNEPNTRYWHFGNGQEGCGFAPTTQNTMIKQLGASLASKGMSYTTESASDETNINTAVSTFGVLDPTAIGYLSQVNTHTYGGNRRTQLLAAATGANKRLWMSEYGDGDGTGLTMAAEILNDLRNMQPSAWIYWQTVDNATGWGFVKNGLDGSANYSYTYNQKFYVMANFSRFIRPGYQFIGMDDANSVAAYDGAGTVALVTRVAGTAPQNVTYSLQNFGIGPWQVTPYQTTSSQNLSQLTSFSVNGGQFTASLPPRSVTTFVLTNGQSSPLVAGKTYQIKNVNSGLLLEDPGFSANSGTRLDQWPTNGGDNQKWVAVAAGSNWIFTNFASGLALDVANFSSWSGSAVDQATVTHSKNQVWMVTPNASGSYKVINQNSGLLLNVRGASSSNGAPIIQWGDSGTSNEAWTFQQLN